MEVGRFPPFSIKMKQKDKKTVLIELYQERTTLENRSSCGISEMEYQFQKAWLNDLNLKIKEIEEDLEDSLIS